MGGGGGGTFRTLNQPWNVHLIIPRNPPGLFVLQHRFTSPNIPCINHYFITPHNWQEAWTTSVSRPLHWHVHASVCVGVCVCVKIKLKKNSLHSLTTLVQQKYWASVAQFLSSSPTFSFCPLRFWRKPDGIARMYVFSLTGKENDWCYFSGNLIKDKHMKWKCHIFSASPWYAFERTIWF